VDAVSFKKKVDLRKTSEEQFLSYTAQTSQSEQTRQRLSSMRDMILRVLGKRKNEHEHLEVADIGCGAGSLCILWAEYGHQRMHGVDIDERLVALGKQRAAAMGFTIDFRVGGSTALPWTDSTMDVCLMPEVLEHVPEWQASLKECARVLRPGGLLMITTTNKFCPRQQEFTLPLYSWYPGWVKRYCERLALTTRPEIANHTRYPAVNWFSFYKLRKELQKVGFGNCVDRFDVMDVEQKGPLVHTIVQGIRTIPVLRWLAYFASPYTLVLAFKANRGEGELRKGLRETHYDIPISVVE
jgi:2-polyprenyl-3-methyl-5-hydroxy-6-metoxy-1,4-benzoquinol methylase